MDIVEELRKDRESGAKRLVSEYKAGLMSLARRFCVNECDAEDLVNATFAKVVDNIDDYFEQSAFFAWMCQILTNLFRESVRRKSNKNEFFPGEVPDIADDGAQEEIFQNLDHALLRDAIQSLPKEMKEVIVMHYLLEEPVARVAKFVGEPVSTVKWRLHVARKALAAKLGAAAKKPGGRALLLALALCGLTALGAAVAFVGDAAFSRVRRDAQAQDAAGQGGGDLQIAATSPDGGPESASPLQGAGQGGGDLQIAATSPDGGPDSAAPSPSTFDKTPQQKTTMNTATLRTLTASAAFAAATGAASTAEANLPPLDSAQFDYKYEMVARPDQQDLDGGGANDFTGWSTAFSLGTGADVGTIKIDASSNGKYLVSNQAVGTAGDGWRSMAASSSTGFTVETRLKITDCTGANGAICIEAGPSDSKVYARLNFFDSSIGWNGTTLTNLDTSAWHTYRIAREGGTATHSVWVDGVLVAENLGSGFTYNNSTLYRMLLGSPGSGWTGKAEVAWLRFHKGAYAPLPPDYRPPRKASTDFPVQYEMASSDARISTTGNASDWTLSGQTGATISKNGVLSVVPNGKQTYWRTTDSVWKDRVTADTTFTFDCEVQIKSCTITGGDRTLQIWIASPHATGNLIIGTNHVYWQLTSSMGDNILLDASDNTDGKHAFRIAYDGATRHGFTVWRDGVKLGENLVDLTAYNGASYSFVRFGIPGSTSGGAFDIGYIRWDTTGAYDWKDPPAPFSLIIR